MSVLLTWTGLKADYFLISWFRSLVFCMQSSYDPDKSVPDSRTEQNEPTKNLPKLVLWNSYRDCCPKNWNTIVQKLIGRLTKTVFFADCIYILFLTNTNFYSEYDKYLFVGWCRLEVLKCKVRQKFIMCLMRVSRMCIIHSG